MAEFGCLKDGCFQNLQVEGNTELSNTSLLNSTIITTINKTLIASDSGATVIMDHAARTITLPTAKAGLHFRIILGKDAVEGCTILTAAATQCFFGHIPLGSIASDKTGEPQRGATYGAATGTPSSFDAMRFIAGTKTIGGVAGTIIELNCVSTVAWHVSIPAHCTSSATPTTCVVIVKR